MTTEEGRDGSRPTREDPHHVGDPGTHRLHPLHPVDKEVDQVMDCLLRTSTHLLHPRQVDLRMARSNRGVGVLVQCPFLLHRLRELDVVDILQLVLLIGVVVMVVGNRVHPLPLERGQHLASTFPL